ncbi:hypothetical protein SVIOM74S_02801 [Streptomyces violarus]
MQPGGALPQVLQRLVDAVRLGVQQRQLSGDQLRQPGPGHVRRIQGLAVSEEVRGRGVGRALVRAAVDEARRRGARRLTLRVLAHNTPARGLYEAEGFVVEGILPEEFLLDGTYVDDVLMGRSL